MRQMKVGRWSVAAVAVFLVALLGACKTSGVAVSERGHVMNIDISVPTDLSEGETKELTASVSNRGVNEIDDVIFEVEMPNELIILSQVSGAGIRMTERYSSIGTKIFQYNAGDLEVGSTAQVRFHVRAAFGSLQRTGDIKVTAWSEDLPGDRLVETKFIRLRA